MLVKKWDIRHFDEVESTNLIVKDKIRESSMVAMNVSPATVMAAMDVCGFVAVAKKQTGGKGMRGHSWCSPEGGLYFSLLLEPTLPPEKLSEIPLRIATVVMEAMQPLSIEPLVIKPPNDIVLNHLTNCKVEKLVGISTELYMEKLCVGIGVNVFRPEQEFRFEGANQPVYLQDFANCDLSIDLVLRTVLDALNAKLEI